MYNHHYHLITVTITITTDLQWPKYSSGVQTEKTLLNIFFFFPHLKLEETFHEYDPLRQGFVTTSDFKKACKEIFEEILTDDEVEEIRTHYCNLRSPSSCNWPKFLHDAESGMDDSSLHGLLIFYLFIFFVVYIEENTSRIDIKV